MAKHSLLSWEVESLVKAPDERNRALDALEAAMDEPWVIPAQRAFLAGWDAKEASLVGPLEQRVIDDLAKEDWQPIDSTPTDRPLSPEEIEEARSRGRAATESGTFHGALRQPETDYMKMCRRCETKAELASLPEDKTLTSKEKTDLKQDLKYDLLAHPRCTCPFVDQPQMTAEQFFNDPQARESIEAGVNFDDHEEADEFYNSKEIFLCEFEGNLHTRDQWIQLWSTPAL